MDKLEQQLASCRRALATLAEAMELPFSIIVRDGSIQRFEYSFESLWKLLKTYLDQYEVRASSAIHRKVVSGKHCRLASFP